MCQHCEWEGAIELIDELLEADEEYVFALSFLESLREWVVENEHITMKQLDALNNVKRGAE